MIIAGFVVLTLKGAETTAYVGLVSPILAAVFVINHLDHRSDRQDQALETITHQTNGVLTERIEQAVAKALEGPSGQAVPPVTPVAPDDGPDGDQLA
jgi:hypothetical protein